MMSRPFLVGERLYLRGLERSDLDGPYAAWMNDPEVTRFLDTGLFPATRETLERYFDTVSASPNSVHFAIIERSSEHHIGNAKLGSINWVHRFADFGIVIGEKACWGRGYGTETTRLVLDYAFSRLNLRKVVLGVVAEQAGAIRCYEAAGFEREGLVKGLYLVEGRPCDKIIMGIDRGRYDDTKRKEP